MGLCAAKEQWIDPGVEGMHYGYAKKPIQHRTLFGRGEENTIEMAGPLSVRVLNYFAKQDAEVESEDNPGVMEIKARHKLTQELFVTVPTRLNLTRTLGILGAVGSVAPLPHVSLCGKGRDPDELLEPSYICAVGEFQGFFVGDNSDQRYGSPRVQGFSMMDPTRGYTGHVPRSVTAITNRNAEQGTVYKPMGVAYYPPLQQLAVTDYRRHKLMLYELVSGDEVCRVINRLDRLAREMKRQEAAEHDRMVDEGKVRKGDDAAAAVAGDEAGDGNGRPRSISRRLLRQASRMVSARSLGTARSTGSADEDEASEGEEHGVELAAKELDRVRDVREAGCWRLLLQVDNYHNMPEAEKLVHPAGCAVNSRGVLLVASSGNHRIQLYSPEGRWLEHWGAAVLNTPMDVTLDEYDNAFVADSGNNCVRLFNRRGVSIARWGSRGFGDEQLLNPTGISWYTRHDPDVCTAGAKAMRFWDEAARLPEERAAKWRELRSFGVDPLWDEEGGTGDAATGAESGDGSGPKGGEAEGKAGEGGGAVHAATDDNDGEREDEEWTDRPPLGDPRNDDDYDDLVRPANEPRAFVEPFRIVGASTYELESWVIENSPLMSPRLRAIGRELQSMTGQTSTSIRDTIRSPRGRASSQPGARAFFDPMSALPDLKRADVAVQWPSPCDCHRCLIVADNGNRRVIEWTLFRISEDVWKFRRSEKQREARRRRRERAEAEALRKAEMMRLALEKKREQDERGAARRERMEKMAARAVKVAERARTKPSKKAPVMQEAGLVYASALGPKAALSSATR